MPSGSDDDKASTAVSTEATNTSGSPSGSSVIGGATVSSATSLTEVQAPTVALPPPATSNTMTPDRTKAPQPSVATATIAPDMTAAAPTPPPTSDAGATTNGALVEPGINHQPTGDQSPDAAALGRRVPGAYSQYDTEDDPASSESRPHLLGGPRWLWRKARDMTEGASDWLRRTNSLVRTGRTGEKTWTRPIASGLDLWHLWRGERRRKALSGIEAKISELEATIEGQRTTLAGRQTDIERERVCLFSPSMDLMR